MYDVVAIKFIGSNRSYYFSNNDLNLKKGMHVVVETERGLQYGLVCSNVMKKEKEKLFLPLKKVIRIATNEDEERNKSNLFLAKKALKSASNFAFKYKLDMKFIDAYITFDKSQLLLNFISDDRVDFRELAKKLASIYKTRIELRQIGVRDKAKEIGGIGPCGRFLCCSTFLNDFNSVSINMAKNQYISLNPTKINGACGRLLCCLKFEDDMYTQMKKDFPPIGTIVKNGHNKGKVVSHNVFMKTYNIETPEKSIIEVKISE